MEKYQPAGLPAGELSAHGASFRRTLARCFAELAKNDTPPLAYPTTLEEARALNGGKVAAENSVAPTPSTSIEDPEAS